MFLVCAKFQDFEIDHIEKMLLFSLNYSEILRKNHEYIRIAQHEFDDRLKSMSGTDILDTFVEQKKTGTDRPGIKAKFYLSNLLLNALFFVRLKYQQLSYNLKKPMV